VAFDETLAERVREALAGEPDVEERLMFGGIAFMASGHMACGVLGGDLVLRLGPDGSERALEQPHVRPMDFTGRRMRSMVVVGAEAVRGEDDLRRWVMAATAFVATLPPKPLSQAADPRAGP
jgi:TfoX/Sxy family transcriptional regulator of competence genes